MKKLSILLVEDNEADIYLITEAFQLAEVNTNLAVVKNGKAAIDFVFKQGLFEEAETPDLIFLDVNLPKANGHEVLKLLKQHEGLRKIPVIMLTTSSSENDIQQSYYNYVNCYITKPFEADAFIKMIDQLMKFWADIVTLPTTKP